MSETELTQRVKDLESLVEEWRPLIAELHLIKRCLVEHEVLLRMALTGKNLSPWHVKTLNVTDGPKVELRVAERHSQEQQAEPQIVTPSAAESAAIAAARIRRP